MKTVLFVPGFKEHINSREYSEAIRSIEAQGYKVEFVPITWLRTTIKDWVRELEAVYSRYDPKDVILAGFSYGAMVCFVTAAKRNPSELWLFSLSPYFAEDITSKDMKQTWLRNIGYRRVEAFSKYNFKDLSHAIKCRTLLFAGEIEVNKWKVLRKRIVLASNLLSNNVRVIIPGAGHDVTAPPYIEAVANTIS